MLISGSKLRNAELQQLTKENPCSWEQTILVLRTCVMFSLYYCFARKLDQYYKSGKYCQMRESYGLSLLFYKSVTVVSLKYSFLQDLCTRNFCIPPLKLSQMKLSMVERWASNKYKSRTTPSRKIIPNF